MKIYGGKCNEKKKEVEGILKTEAVKKWIENDSYAIGIYDIENRKIN